MKAKKSLGQNFLHAKRYIHKAVASLEIIPEDVVVEIGPGKGALTEHILLAKPRQVIAIEADQRMVEYLHERFYDELKQNKLVIVHNDVLQVQIDTLIGTQPYKLIGNLPFYITGAIFKKFLSQDRQPTCITAITQKEVAERITSREGKESILSLSVQAFGTPQYLGKIPKKSFTPAPKVDAALVHIHNISHTNFSSSEQEHAFFTLIKTAFAHKRKQIKNNLAELYTSEQLAKIQDVCDIQLDDRAENISLSQWLCILTNYKPLNKEE